MDGEFVLGFMIVFVCEFIVVLLFRFFFRFVESRWANRGVLYLIGINVDYDEEEVKDMLLIEFEGMMVVDDLVNVFE